MRTGVEVNGIGDIGEGQRIGCRDINVLAPGRRTDNDDAVGVDITNHRNNFIRIGLDTATPGNAVRFVGNFINQVRRVAIAVSHFREEPFRGFFMDIRITIRQDVPIDNDVHVQGNRRIDDFPYLVRDTGIFDVTTFFSVHCRADNVRVPVIAQPANAVNVHPGSRIGPLQAQ